METQQQQPRLTAALFDKAMPVLGGLGCVLATLVLCLGTLGRPLYFDEYLHAHNLWLVSIGRVPHEDFWCNYPALGYVIIRPFFHLLPESIYSVFALRFLGLCCLGGLAAVLYFHARRLGVKWIWALVPLAVVAVTPAVGSLVAEFRTDAYAAPLAILALALMFREPTPLRSGLAASLSTLSLMIMPKYFYPLLATHLAYLGYGCLKLKHLRRSLVTSALFGGVAAVVLTQLLLWTSGVRLWRDIYWSSIFMQNFYAHCARTEPTRISFQIFSYSSECWWVALMLLAGIWGWFAASWKKKENQLWVGLALITSLVFYWGTCPLPYRQHFVPGLFCLLLFMPYVATLLKNQTLQTSGATLLFLLCAVTSVYYLTAEVIPGLASGAAFADFPMRQLLLDSIPRSERVVGLNETHPCFREDQTFVTYDECVGNPPGFTPLMSNNSAILDYFQPEYLKQSLERAAPASIAIGSINYPPGWNEVLADFLRRHGNEYQELKIGGKSVSERTIFLRKDLQKE